VKRLLLQNVCDLSNNMNGLRFPCFVKSGNAEVSALHHYVPDLHRRMLLATLWNNTYICINEALALTLSDFLWSRRIHTASCLPSQRSSNRACSSSVTRIVSILSRFIGTSPHEQKPLHGRHQ